MIVKLAVNIGFFFLTDNPIASYTSEYKAKCKELKNITTEARGKIFPTNPSSAELIDTQNDTKMLKDIIESVTSRCQEELEAEKLVDAKDSDDHDTGDNFYQKLFCLVNGVNEDCSTRGNKKNINDRSRNLTSPEVNGLGQSSCSLEKRVSELEAMLAQEQKSYQEAVSKYERDIAKYLALIDSLEESLRKTEEALNEIATEYYGIKAENEKKKKDAQFRKLLKLNSEPSTSEISHQSDSEETNTQVTIPNREHQIIMEESSSRAEQTLTNIPTSSVELQLYYAYKLLLLRISDMLLHHDKEMLQDWATRNYSIQASENAYQILVQLDEKKMISSSNLCGLKDFFGAITRYDLVHIIENFIAGDYSLLRKTQSARVRNRNIRGNGTLRLQATGFVHPQLHTTSNRPKTSVEQMRIELKREKIPQDRSWQATIIEARGPVGGDGDYNRAGEVLAKIKILLKKYGFLHRAKISRIK